MRILAVDIETVPQSRYVAPPAYALIDGGDVELDAAYVEAFRTDPITRAHSAEGVVDLTRLATEIESGQGILKATGVVPSLHPTTCHVVAINYGWTDSEGAIQTDVRCLPDFSDPPRELLDQERCLLLELFCRMRGAIDKETLIVTFNGKGFDLWLCQVRAALIDIYRGGITRVQLPWQRLLYPWDNKGLHCDLRIVLGNEKRSRGTQQHWAEAFGIHSEERGGEVFQMVKDGRWDDLRSYGRSEGKTLVEFFQRIEPVL